MRRPVCLTAVALALAAGCAAGEEHSLSPPPAGAVERGAPSTTRPDTGPYEAVPMPFASRAWLNRVEGTLVVESCQEADAFVARGRSLREVVEYRTYTCGPSVTATVVEARRGVADLFARR